MRDVGLHVRLQQSFAELAERALRLKLRTFQCFFVGQESKRHLKLTPDDAATFVVQRHLFGNLYVHASYWINLCAPKEHVSHYLVKKELKIAQRLGFTHYVIHPGFTAQYADHQTGLDALVKTLNENTRKYTSITIVLENTAHGTSNIGSDLQDFAYIKERLDQPERIAFCIDTAHAHAFGYNLIDDVSREQFITLLDQTVGINAIALIHLNDTYEALGSRKDKHAPIGAGLIGDTALKKFVLAPQLAHIPVIIEPPELIDDNLTFLAAKVIDWHR